MAKYFTVPSLSNAKSKTRVMHISSVFYTNQAAQDTSFCKRAYYCYITRGGMLETLWSHTRNPTQTRLSVACYKINHSTHMPPPSN